MIVLRPITPREYESVSTRYEQGISTGVSKTIKLVTYDFDIRKLQNVLKSSMFAAEAGMKAAAYSSLVAFKRICIRYFTEFSTGTRPSILNCSDGNNVRHRGDSGGIGRPAT